MYTVIRDGIRARAVGVASMPFGVAIEVEGIFQFA